MPVLRGRKEMTMQIESIGGRAVESSIFQEESEGTSKEIGPSEDPFKGSSWPDEEARLSEMIHALESQTLQIADTVVTYTDPNNMVTVKVGGRGDALDIKFYAASISFPKRLGSLVTEALAAAREESDRNRVAMQEDLPFDLPEIDKVLDVLPSVQGGNIRRYKDPIMEFVAATQALAREHETRFIDSEIGRGLGTVSCNLLADRIEIEIDSSASRLVGLDNLASLTMQAVEESQYRAAQIRKEESANLRRIHEQRMI